MIKNNLIPILSSLITLILTLIIPHVLGLPNTIELVINNLMVMILYIINTLVIVLTLK